jgi:DNA-binding HxlR family transcriptional regulator
VRYDAFAMKRYDQYCPVCHALGLVGERWALLVVRELLKGPKRYTDLLDGLPGVGTNILAARLRELEGNFLRIQAPSRFRISRWTLKY